MTAHLKAGDQVTFTVPPLTDNLLEQLGLGAGDYSGIIERYSHTEKNLGQVWWVRVQPSGPSLQLPEDDPDWKLRRVKQW